MAFSRKARKALQRSRQGKSSLARYHAMVDAGEEAFNRGIKIEQCPYEGVDREDWQEGWYLACIDYQRSN